MSRRPSRDLKAKSRQRIAGKLFLSEFNYESPMEELRRLKCFQTRNACMVMYSKVITIWAEMTDQALFFPRWKVTVYKNIIKNKLRYLSSNIPGKWCRVVIPLPMWHFDASSKCPYIYTNCIKW